MTLDLRLGHYRDVLADVTCDAVICDPPYGARVHDGDVGKLDLDVQREQLTYAAWTPQDVADFVAFWSTRNRGWFACMTSHDLAPAWESAYRDAGLFSFMPLPIVGPCNVRMGGDGPGSGVVWMMVARPRSAEWSKWRSLPSWYHTTERGKHIGGKSISLMRDIVRDYSREGALVCDPCAGRGSTLYAARQERRLAVGAEIDPETYSLAVGEDLPLFGVI